MRTHKRNTKARACTKAIAGVRGRPRSQCPRGALGLRSQWLEGWLSGAEERANGTLALFGLHKPASGHGAGAAKARATRDTSAGP